MEVTEQILPHMSVAKQDRIRIWRHEVAAAHVEPDGSSSLSGSPSGAASSSATSTTTSSSTSSRSVLVLARGRHLLSKLAHKLRPSSSSSPSSDRFWRGGAAVDGPGATRTAMYATLSPDYNPDVVPHDDEEEEWDFSGEDGQQPPRDAALREKQERLMRAAKLLDKGRALETN